MPKHDFKLLCHLFHGTLTQQMHCSWAHPPVPVWWMYVGGQDGEGGVLSRILFLAIEGKEEVVAIIGIDIEGQ